MEVLEEGEIRSSKTAYLSLSGASWLEEDFETAIDEKLRTNGEDDNYLFDGRTSDNDSFGTDGTCDTAHELWKLNHEAAIEKLRNAYDAKMAALQDQVHSLQQEHLRLQNQSLEQQKKHQLELEQLGTTERGTMEDIRKKQQELLRHFPAIQKQTDEWQTQLSQKNIKISTAKFEELKKRPANTLTPREFMQLAVHRGLKSNADELESKRVEVEQLRDKLSEATQREEHEILRNRSSLQSAKEREAELRRMNTTYEQNIRELRQELTKNVNKVQKVAAQASQYEKLFAEASTTEKLYKDAKHMLDINITELKATKAERKSLRKQADSWDKRIQILEADKLHLSKENNTLQLKIDRLQRSRVFIMNFKFNFFSYEILYLTNFEFNFFYNTCWTVKS